MICGECFKNDPMWVQDIQDSVYMSHVWRIFDIARSVYRQAEKTLVITTPLGRDVENVSRIDHKPIQHMHDMIAASFRYRNLDRINDNIHGQQYFPECDENYANEEYIERQWCDYYIETIKFLYNEYPSLVKQVLIAVTYPSPDSRGINAEKYISQMLSDIFIFV